MHDSDGVMKHPKRTTKSSAALERGQQAVSLLAEIFQKAGWRVESKPKGHNSELDMIVRLSGDVIYAVGLQAAVEGRADRLLPLFSQAVLQSQHGAAGNARPLAVVAAPKISHGAAQQIFEFAERYAPNVAVGVIDFEGLRSFRGPHLDGLNAEVPRKASIATKATIFAGHLFSDLNQWMLKILLATEFSEELLSAPRGEYRNASQLAQAANVSIMSAFRFVQQLQSEGFLSESSSYLNLVRRQELFQRWQASTLRPIKEVNMRFLLKGQPTTQLSRFLYRSHACLALFAAAQALKLGFVEGVPPYVYVERIQPSSLAALKNIRPCEPGESPDLIVRQAPAPQSIFRGIVRPKGMPVSDVLQVWLDVSSHPSRGREQADLIRKRVLEPVIRENR
jgi:hypothetical protein